MYRIRAGFRSLHVLRLWVECSRVLVFSICQVDCPPVRSVSNRPCLGGGGLALYSSAVFTGIGFSKSERRLSWHMSRNHRPEKWDRKARRIPKANGWAARSFDVALGWRFSTNLLRAGTLRSECTDLRFE